MSSHLIIHTPQENNDQKRMTVNDLSSSIQHFQWSDYVVFASMLIVSVVIGVYFGFYDKNTKNNGNRESEGFAVLQYFLGGRKMNVFPVSVSQIVSVISGITVLGVSREIYIYGLQYIFLTISTVIAAIITWYICLPVLYDLRLTSIYEYLELRFDRKVRMFGSFIFIIISCLWLPIVMYAPALAFNQVTGLNKEVVIVVTSIVCIFYTFLGGIKAVVWTDVFQAFIMIGSLFVIAIKGTMDAGGLNEIIYYNLKTGRRAFVITVMGMKLISLVCAYKGLLIYAKYHDCDPLSTKLLKTEDQLLPLFVMETLGMYPGLAGLFVAGIFSATLSTLSSGLNSLSAVILEDFCKPYARNPLSEKKTFFIIKSTVIVFGVICLGFVFVVEKLGMIFPLYYTFTAVTNGALCGTFLVGMLIPWFNTKSILFGSISAFGILVWICGNAQYALAIGEIVFPRKPTSTSGCTYSFTKTVCVSNSTTINELSTKSIYHLSYLLYAPLGVALTIVFSGLASLIFGRNDPKSIDKRLLAPFLRKYFTSAKYSNVRPEEHEQESN